ncbi:MAG: hypothetical protein H0T97_02925 [Actinobacteria bacterium]|nr:hypothetical protein [Actinomycetota bacterium]
MPETANDGFYWEPETDFPLRQGDLLYNVPTGLMPDQPRFVIGDGEEVQAVAYDEFPDAAPSGDIVVEARFAALAMVVTPTCHVAEGEKDEDILAVVPVDPLGALIPDRNRARNIAGGKNVPLHFFPLPPTELGDRILPLHAVALLDRPASLLKHNLIEYRRLALYLEARIKLRAQLSNFWARANAEGRIRESIEAQQRSGRELEDLE